LSGGKFFTRGVKHSISVVQPLKDFLKFTGEIYIQRSVRDREQKTVGFLFSEFCGKPQNSSRRFAIRVRDRSGNTADPL
jgi:hypothetical protein